MKRVVSVFLCLALAACGGSDDTPDTAVSGVGMNKPTLALATDGSETLVATVEPSTALNKAVEWNSTDQATATVNASGLVTAIDVGQTTITATTAEGGLTASCAVSVTIQKAGWEQIQPTQIKFTDTGRDAWVSFYFVDRKCTSAQAQYNYGTNQAAQVSFDGLSAAARADGEVNGTSFWVDVTGALLGPFANKTMAQIAAMSDITGEMFTALAPANN